MRREIGVSSGRAREARSAVDIVYSVYRKDRFAKLQNPENIV